MKTAHPDLVVESNPAPADENATHGLKHKYWMGEGWRIRVRLPDGLYAYEKDGWVMLSTMSWPPGDEPFVGPPRKVVGGNHVSIDGFDQHPHALEAYRLIVATAELMGLL